MFNQIFVSGYPTTQSSWLIKLTIAVTQPNHWTMMLFSEPLQYLHDPLKMWRLTLTTPCNNDSCMWLKGRKDRFPVLASQQGPHWYNLPLTCDGVMNTESAAALAPDTASHRGSPQVCFQTSASPGIPPRLQMAPRDLALGFDLGATGDKNDDTITTLYSVLGIPCQHLGAPVILHGWFIFPHFHRWEKWQSHR